MTVDANGRSHEPAGTPAGGRYARGRARKTDDVEPPSPRRRAAAGSFADFARTLPNLASYRRDGDTATLGFDDGRVLTVAHAGGTTTFTLADAEGRIIYRSVQHPADCPPRYRRSALRRMTKRLASRTQGFMPEPDLADQRTLADGTVLTVDDTAYGFVLEASDADGRTLHRGEYRRERYGRYGAYLAARREALDRAQHAIEKGGPELINYRDDEHRGLDVNVVPSTLPLREVIVGVPSIRRG